MSAAKKNKQGRKSKYYTHVEPKLELIRNWRQQGISEQDIAFKLGIAYSTLKVYKNEIPAFSAIISTSKEKLVSKIKKSLWKEAIGYEYEEKTEYVEGILDENGKFTGKKKIKRTTTTKFSRPQASLVQFALCNLCPEEFQRVDKEAVKELENKIDEKLRLDNSVFKKEFERLYPKTSGDKNE